MSKAERRFKSISRQASWFLPGLYFKRWFGLVLLGFLLFTVGIALLLNLQPISLTISIIRFVAPIIPSWLSGAISLLVGASLLVFGWRQTTTNLVSAVDNVRESSDILEALYRKGKLDNGPRILAIGGGTGLANLLSGLKQYTTHITAVVTVADDGGSSGRLRQEFGIIPPGDIRNCIAALSDEDSLITTLFQYRFKSGEGLQGHSFGNLFLSVMCEITGNMMAAVKESSKVLNIRGTVLPASLDNVSLVAELENGQTVRGESVIPEAGSRILKLMVDPSTAKVLPEVVTAIQKADLIILGPGSLYTSILPNLLIHGLVDALDKAAAPKIYVCNVMSQPGETDGFTVCDHLQVFWDHCPGKRIVDAVVVNNWIPETLVARYQQSGAEPVLIDKEKLTAKGIAVIEQLLIDEGQHTAKHNPKRLSRTIINWFKRESRRRVKNVNEYLKGHSLP
jgi:uncharacterized cofD-like protein